MAYALRLRPESLHPLVTCAALAQSGGDAKKWPRTDFSRRTVELVEIQSGGPSKDGIPAIDRPKLVSPQLARTWLGPREPVIALPLEDEARAYPLQILMFIGERTRCHIAAADRHHCQHFLSNELPPLSVMIRLFIGLMGIGVKFENLLGGSPEFIKPFEWRCTK